MHVSIRFTVPVVAVIHALLLFFLLLSRCIHSCVAFIQTCAHSYTALSHALHAFCFCFLLSCISYVGPYPLAYFFPYYVSHTRPRACVVSLPCIKSNVQVLVRADGYKAPSFPHSCFLFSPVHITYFTGIRNAPLFGTANLHLFSSTLKNHLVTTTYHKNEILKGIDHVSFKPL